MRSPDAVACDLQDLKCEVDRAIQMHGETSKWYGLDDGSMVVSHDGVDVWKIGTDFYGRDVKCSTNI